MKNQYVKQCGRWLMAVWLIGTMTLNTWAQSNQPPTIRWQRTINNTDGTLTTGTPAANVRAVRAGNGGYTLLAGKNLIHLSADGTVVWNKSLEGAYFDSLAAYVAVREAKSLAATPDSGFVVLGLDVKNRYFVTKVNAAGNRVWTKALHSADVGPSVQITKDAIGVAADGSVLVAGTYRDVAPYLTLAKLNREGVIVSQWRIRFADAGQFVTPHIRAVLPRSDGGFLLAGGTADSGSSEGNGLAIQINEKSEIVWQKTYPAVFALHDIVPNASVNGTYTAVGLGAGEVSRVLTVAPNGAGDGAIGATLTGTASEPALTYDGAGYLTVLDGVSQNAGDFRLTNFTPPAAVRWTALLGGAGADVPSALLPTADGGYLAVGTTTSTNGNGSSRAAASQAIWVVKLGGTPSVNPLTLLAPTYDCQTGRIVFNTSGGDGSPITYSAAGVVRTSATDNVGTVELGLRTDPKVIPIRATQNGQTVSYDFDLESFCSGKTAPPDTGMIAMSELRLILPVYNCRTGAFAFRVTGGDGSPVAYKAAGITDWTTDSSQVIEAALRTASDIQPFLLMARQNGRVVTLLWNLKAECGRARIGADEPAGLSVSVLGNPVSDAVTIEVTGASGQSLQMHLFDARGRLVEGRVIEPATAAERQTFDLHRQPTGTLLLQTTANGQTQTVKVIKQ